MRKPKTQKTAKKGAAEVTLTPEEVILRRRRRIANREDVKSFLTQLFVLILILWVLFGFVFGITPMPNDDMKPRISSGDLLFYYRLEDSWHSEDVVVFEKDGKQYVGRIVAKGGDSIEITEDARVVVNGSYVVENDIYYSTPLYESDVVYPIALEEDQFFVLCDYRQGAKDSRYFGAVDLNEVKGKVITVIRRSGL
ncbi:MAG: signal peptidase I [Lachnospiraceae bacterium]|nr:signal peptidase I [Lachnospiraceae bacterium]